MFALIGYGNFGCPFFACLCPADIAGNLAVNLNDNRSGGIATLVGVKIVFSYFNASNNILAAEKLFARCAGGIQLLFAVCILIVNGDFRCLCFNKNNFCAVRIGNGFVARLILCGNGKGQFFIKKIFEGFGILVNGKGCNPLILERTPFFNCRRIIEHNIVCGIASFVNDKLTAVIGVIFIALVNIEQSSVGNRHFKRNVAGSIDTAFAYLVRACIIRIAVLHAVNLRHGKVKGGIYIVSGFVNGTVYNIDIICQCVRMSVYAVFVCRNFVPCFCTKLFLKGFNIAEIFVFNFFQNVLVKRCVGADNSIFNRLKTAVLIGSLHFVGIGFCIVFDCEVRSNRISLHRKG